MGWIQSFTCITACVLLLQQSTVSALPMNEPRALMKRGATLTGKFLHITGKIHFEFKYYNHSLTNFNIYRYSYRSKIFRRRRS